MNISGETKSKGVPSSIRGAALFSRAEMKMFKFGKLLISCDQKRTSGLSWL